MVLVGIKIMILFTFVPVNRFRRFFRRFRKIECAFPGWIVIRRLIRFRKIECAFPGWIVIRRMSVFEKKSAPAEDISPMPGRSFLLFVNGRASAVNRRECLFQRIDQVVDMLGADRQTDRIRKYSAVSELRLTEL